MRGLPWACVVALVVALVSRPTFGQIVDDQATRPPPLAPAPACELWEGTVSGNDPSVLVHARLCPAGDHVTGVLQWSSLRSGWNVRDIEGTWSPDHTALTLRDLRVTESRPQPGWRFCTVDRYDLRAVGLDVLTGSYVSRACDDHAQVELRRSQRAEAVEVPRLPAPPVVPTAPAMPPRPQRRRFGCSIDATVSARGVIPRCSLWLAVVASCARPRRPRRTSRN